MIFCGDVGDVHMASNIIHWRTRLNMDAGFVVYLRDQCLCSIGVVKKYSLLL
jgi:hypothetical protein